MRDNTGRHRETAAEGQSQVESCRGRDRLSQNDKEQRDTNIHRDTEIGTERQGLKNKKAERRADRETRTGRGKGQSLGRDGALGIWGRPASQEDSA